MGRAPRISHELTTICPDAIKPDRMYTYKGESGKCWEYVLSSIVLWEGDYTDN